ncbi:PX domain containing protein [Acanthamoeba castellanii str. Neff]|uniref:PX domain containing protein n=1 Tax=Acanthamoeba castellanii (strain ATCC 30010 / Neff) TaxID=1257118 RepID=L8H7T6_ACACF|nr:PX domain containing protein [Acanthamoeba castellanii str. Neff]ELR21307.1 PX domain containing protein [Acanthamoeba castellanii str. Neff]
MGNIASSNDEDFSKTIDFCKQLRLLHFVVNEPKTYSETYSQFQACIGGDEGEGDEAGALKSQHKELARRIEEIDFDEYRLMFSIRRILFSAPFRGSIIGYDLVPVDVDSKSRRVKYVISFDTHEHRPPSSSAPSPCPTESETGGASGGIKSYRTKRSYNEFLQLDERIRNLFSTAKERQDKRQLEEELDRRDRFMRQLEKSGSSSSSSSATTQTSTKEDASSVEERRPSMEEVQLEDDFWIYVKPKHLQKRSSKEMSVEEDKEKEKDEDKGEEEEEEDGYDGLKLPPLPPKQFCWDDASRLAVAETRMPLLEAYLQAVFANAYLTNHEVFLRFLFSPDSFGDDIEVDDENAEVDGAGQQKKRKTSGAEAADAAEAVLTPKTRQRSDYEGAAIVDDYETPAARSSTAVDIRDHPASGKARQTSPRLPKLSGELVIIDDWERAEEEQQEEQEEKANPTTASATEPPAAILQESVEELFGSSPFFSLMDTIKDPARGIIGDEAEQQQQQDPAKEQDPELLPPRDLRDDWSFLCVELAVCKRRHSRRRGGKKAAEAAHGKEGEEEERLEADDRETQRLIERTRTLELKAQARTKQQQQQRPRVRVSCDGLPDGSQQRNLRGRELSGSADGEQADKTRERRRRLVAEDDYEAEDEIEERERHKRVMSRLHEAEEWVNRLDGGRRRSGGKKQRRRWRVTSVESFVLSTGTGELPSALRKCLEKQAKTLMVAHGLASGKTGAIIASKKGAATLLQKSLAILGVTTSREVNLMMAACLQLALSRVLLFLRLNSLEAYLSSRFFIHSSTYLGRVASMSAINSAQLIAKASILGALVAFLVEEIHLFVLFLRVWKVNGEKGLDLRQFIKGTVVNLASNTSAYAGAIAGGTIGTMIEPGGGTIIGSLIGGILCGLLVSFGSDYVYSKYYGEEDEEDAVEMEDFNRALSAEEEMEAEDEQWEQLHLNADLWEDLVAEFEQLDGNEYEADTIDDIRREHEEASAQTRPQKKGGSGRKKRRSGSDAKPSSLATKWGRVMSAARRRRRPSKANTREGTRAQGESSQSPH